jgi:rRNA processing protein Gar1
LIGRGDVTFLHIAYVKSTKNVGKLTCVFGRFKNPFFLWLIKILKAATMIMVTAIAFFLVIYAQPSHSIGERFEK